MYLLGVDGGGSKTRFLLVDSSGNIAVEKECGGTNYHQIGIGKAASVIGNVMNGIMDSTNISWSEIGGAILGLGAVDEIRSDTENLFAAVQDALPGVPCRIVNDVVVGWAGALALKPGIYIGAGTGSIAYGKDLDGRETRCGGWGHQIGDEGSANWIGRNLIQLFSKQSDGRLSKSPAYDLVKEHFSLENDFELISHYRTMNRGDVAALNKLASSAAAKGDEYVTGLYERAAEELVQLALAVTRTGRYGDEPKITGTGGLFRSGDFIVKPFQNKLRENGCGYVEPYLDGAGGAVLMAVRKFGTGRITAIGKHLKRREPLS